MKNSRQTLVKLCATALFMALTVVTSSFSIPVPGGHLYINDVVICVAAILLEPLYAAAAGGIGAFLGDFFFYPTPMFVSLVTHGVQALVISLLVRKLKLKHEWIAASVAVAVGAVIMIAGYSFGRAYIYATPEIALVKLPYQILQAAVGAVAGVVLCYPLGLVKARDKLLGE